MCYVKSYYDITLMHLLTIVILRILLKYNVHFFYSNS